MTTSGSRLLVVPLLAVLLVATGCGGKDDEADGKDGRTGAHAPAALVAAPGPKKCLPPGEYLYFQLVRVREPVRISYLETGVKQTDMAEPAGVETKRMWVHVKPKRFKATQGTRPWPYGMGATVSRMTGWKDSWDPTQLPDENPRYLQRGWNYVFVLIEGRHAARSDIRIGWESKSRRQGEISLGRAVWFNKRCT